MPYQPPENLDNMTDLRAQIDALDVALVRLFALRQKHVDRAAQLKPAAGLPARIDERIEAVVSKVEASARIEGFEPDTAGKLWRVLIEDMIAREERAMTKGDTK